MSTISLLHTPEQIKALSFKSEKLSELKVLANNVNSLCNDTQLQEVVKQWEDEIQSELKKYDHLIGKRIRITPKYKSFHNYVNYTGTITEITHFNHYSHSVRCRVHHDADEFGNYKSGFTGEALIELTLID